MHSTLILPPAPARKPALPRTQPSNRSRHDVPRRSPRPAIAPPAMDAAYYAWCDGREDDAREAQDADALADLPEWMERPLGMDGKPGPALGEGLVVNDRLVWTQPPVGNA